jgi:hypothetical protein
MEPGDVDAPAFYERAYAQGHREQPDSVAHRQDAPKLVQRFFILEKFTLQDARIVVHEFIRGARHGFNFIERRIDDWQVGGGPKLSPGESLVVLCGEQLAKQRARAIGIIVFFNPIAATNSRTLSGPACFRHISVPVLSLWRIMASSAVRSETLPIRFGGLNVALSSDQTLASSAS